MGQDEVKEHSKLSFLITTSATVSALSFISFLGFLHRIFNFFLFLIFVLNSLLLKVLMIWQCII